VLRHARRGSGALRASGDELARSLVQRYRGSHARRRAHESPRRGEALRSAIERVMPTIERLLDPRTSGRGGAAFSPLSTSEVTFLTAPMALPSRVVLDSRPFIQPLLELLDEGRPAGVVLVSAHAAELLEWRFGTCVRVPIRGPKGAHRRRGSLKVVQRCLDRHVRLRPGCGVAVEFVAAEQIWGEIPPRDLAWRPPERLFRSLAGVLVAGESAA
jgi:hypothetical protein